jgi:hypothetical protein
MATGIGGITTARRLPGRGVCAISFNDHGLPNWDVEVAFAFGPDRQTAGQMQQMDDGVAEPSFKVAPNETTGWGGRTSRPRWA